MGSYITNPKFTLIDDNGSPYSGALVYFYEPETTTKKAIYTDLALSIAASNPLTLDSRGEASVFGSGTYKIVANAPNATPPDTPDDVIWSADNVFPTGNFIAGDTATVASIAEMRGITGESGASIKALGYYAVGDGGGGPIRYWSTTSTATDNGGSIIKPTAIGVGDPGRWIWEHNGPISPRWFGAKCDGVTDDGAIINTALAYKEGAQVWTEEETCATSVTIEIPSGSELKGIGGGQYPTVANYASANFTATAKSRIVALAGFTAGEPVVRVKTADSALYVKHNVTLKGMMIDCAGIADYGLDVISVKHSTFENLLIYRPVLVGIREDVLPIADAATEGNSATQFNNWRDVTAWAGEVGAAVGWQQKGTNTHDINLCTYLNCRAVTYHGDAIQISGADTQAWIQLYTYNFGKGKGVRLYGSDDAAAPFAKAHGITFYSPILTGSSHIATAQTGGASTITLAASAPSDSTIYEGRVIFISALTGKGQRRIITSYDGATKIATVDSPWNTIPDATSGYTIYAGGMHVQSGTTSNSVRNTVYGYTHGSGPIIVDDGAHISTIAPAFHPLGIYTQRFTPAVDFVTTGDLSVSYTKASGRYTVEGNRVKFVLDITFTPTYTTASSNIKITGLPYSSLDVLSGNDFYPAQVLTSSTAWTWGGAGITQIVGRITSGANYIRILGMGSGTLNAFLGVTQFPSGGTYTLNISGEYEMAGIE
jgi:hypothetical protein